MTKTRALFNLFVRTVVVLSASYTIFGLVGGAVLYLLVHTTDRLFFSHLEMRPFTYFEASLWAFGAAVVALNLPSRKHTIEIIEVDTGGGDDL